MSSSHEEEKDAAYVIPDAEASQPETVADEATPEQETIVPSATESQGEAEKEVLSTGVDVQDAQVEQPQADTAAESIEQLRAQIQELSNQVTGLNEKLVRSFNRMSDVEDDYSDAQEKVRTTSARIAELEKERAEHLDALNTGLLVEKVHVSSEMQRMMDRVIEETAQRGKAESDKTKIEAELDELSSSLFSEANKMVAVERLSRARAEEKSRNMEERLKDTEGIMLEQQKVLADLQHQVERLQASPRTTETTLADNDDASVHLMTTSDLARSVSQRTTHMQRKHRPLADPSSDLRLMINIIPYQEFRAFIVHLRKLRKQLAPFYNYPLQDPTDRSLTPRITSPVPQRAGTPSGSTISSAVYAIGSALPSSSPFAAAGVGRHRDHPSLPANVETMVQLPNQLSLPFIKRSQEEDIDPCLRLDFAPGLNWLSRRQANTAILDGNLVIEPLFPGSANLDCDALRRTYAHLPPAACAMCGILVVNVPLPGGATATTPSSEQGGKSSASWASTAASSFGSITGSTNSTNTLTPRPSRAGLFSSFRKSSQNVKAEVEASAPARLDPEVGSVPESLLSADIPVPTHIFRLSESAPTRYLLCPHHCLLRLRAACQYWGFVRNLERSIVIEGKFVSDEQLPPSVNASTTDLVVPEPVEEKSNTVDTLEKAVTEEADTHTNGDLQPDEAATEQSEETKPDAEVIVDAPAGGVEQSMEAEESKQASEEVNEPDSESPAVPEETSPEALTEEPKDANTDEEPAGEDKETEKAEEDKQSTLFVPPPVPPRSAARGSGTTSPAPALPPRRPPRTSSSVNRPEPKFAAPTVTSLDLSKFDAMDWEDKMWTEITKLKEELWRARIGLVCE